MVHGGRHGLVPFILDEGGGVRLANMQIFHALANLSEIAEISSDGESSRCQSRVPETLNPEQVASAYWVYIISGIRSPCVHV